ncbi:hypothetical protein Q8F55_000578 [Vanrija albida]|uniref:F-box domain-containing protein n=1 Tax=Vanrija albida TaxID=181172 RepID=A0ABR3QDN4_9TREE
MDARRLPPEIWHMVLEHLDVNADRQTFLALLRVSSSLWYEAARVLYRNLDISGDNMSKLLLASSPKPPSKPPTAASDPKRHHWACPNGRRHVDDSDSESAASTECDPAESECHRGCLPEDAPQTPDLSPRTRQALSFIKRLNLRNLVYWHVEVMLDAAVPGVVLFSGVTTLHIYSTDPSLLPAGHINYYRCQVLFGTVDLCVSGAAPIIISTSS